MTRDDFLRTLSSGLAGMPPQEIEDIVGDYTAHFAESEKSGRSEAEVAAALGDPARIARELRAEAGVRRFEAHWSVSNLFAATFALAGLAIIDIVFLLPLLITALAVALALAITLVAVGALGLNIIIATLFLDAGGSFSVTLGRLFVGAGLVSCLVGGGALLLLGWSAGIRMLGNYARLHSRVARPGGDRV